MYEVKKIPVMTDPLGKYWEQPKLEDISFSLVYAWMTPKEFQQLKRYQTSTPTGVYAGKMWKMTAWTGKGRSSKEEWLLCYFDTEYKKEGQPGHIFFPIKFFIIRFEP